MLNRGNEIGYIISVSFETERKRGTRNPVLKIIRIQGIKSMIIKAFHSVEPQSR